MTTAIILPIAIVLALLCVVLLYVSGCSFLSALFEIRQTTQRLLFWLALSSMLTAFVAGGSSIHYFVRFARTIEWTNKPDRTE